MPPKIKIKKEDIICVSLQMIRNSGIESLNARAIAKQLNCSIQPVFSNFKTMEELKQELIQQILLTYHEYMETSVDKEPAYKSLGINYIRFAKEEPKFFQTLFMGETGVEANNYIAIDKTFNDAIKEGKNATGLTEEQMKKFHFNIWLTTHGVATLIATKACVFTDTQIKEILSDAFSGQKALIKEGKYV